MMPLTLEVLHETVSNRYRYCTQEPAQLELATAAEHWHKDSPDLKLIITSNSHEHWQAANLNFKFIATPSPSQPEA